MTSIALSLCWQFISISKRNNCNSAQGLPKPLLKRSLFYLRDAFRLAATNALPNPLPRILSNCNLYSSSSATFCGKETSLSTIPAPISQHRFSVAPMMDYTDCHQHYLQRLLSTQSILYTEMIGCSTLVNTDDPAKHLEGYLQHVSGEDRSKTILQLGGSNIEHMRKASAIAYKFGFTEININSGCPSDKVADEGSFGASLMRRPQHVAHLAQAISEATGAPATVKCRIGVDDDDSYEQLTEYIRLVSEQGGVRHFVVHARKAILGGKLSPADNRRIPPLRYDYVYRLIEDFPNLDFTLNGGVNSYDDVLGHLSHGVHGVMVGRSVIGAPFYWAEVDSRVYGMRDPGLTRGQVLSRYAEYACEFEKRESRARHVLMKPVLGLFNGQFNGRLFRNKVDTLMNRKSTPFMLAGEALLRAAECLPPSVMDATANALINNNAPALDSNNGRDTGAAVKNDSSNGMSENEESCAINELKTQSESKVLQSSSVSS